MEDKWDFIYFSELIQENKTYIIIFVIVCIFISKSNYNYIRKNNTGFKKISYKFVEISTWNTSYKKCCIISANLWEFKIVEDKREDIFTVLKVYHPYKILYLVGEIKKRANQIHAKYIIMENVYTK